MVIKAQKIKSNLKVVAMRSDIFLDLVVPLYHTYPPIPPLLQGRRRLRFYACLHQQRKAPEQTLHVPPDSLIFLFITLYAFYIYPYIPLDTLIYPYISLYATWGPLGLGWGFSVH